jgi:hypothetical protein
MSKKYKKKNQTPSKTPASQSKSPDTPVKQVSKRKGSPKKSFIIENWRQVSIISLLAIALYVESASFDYVLDDTILIVNNKFTQKGIAGIPEIFTNETFKGYFGDQGEMVEGGRYRPLSLATFALEKSITGGNKAASHLINVLLYVLTGIFLYRVLLFMFPKARSGQTEKKWFFTVPFVAAILFIAHPLHVEVVANVKGRDEIFALIAEAAILYFSFKWLAEKKSKYLIYSSLCFFFGLLSKENVLTFLAIVPITAYFFTNSSRSDKIKITAPLFVATIIYLVIRVNVLGFLFSGNEITNLMNNPFYGMSFGEKMATVFFTLLLYLKLLVYPHPLTHDYYPYHIHVMHWTDWAPILSLLLHLAFIAIMIKGWKKKTTWAYSIAFYLVTLSIVSNLVISVGTFMNERFLYHASLGFCIAVAWLLVEKLDYNRVIRWISFSVFCLFTLELSALTLIRLPDWKTPESLDRSALKVSPDSARSNHFFGVLIWSNLYLKLPPNADSATRKAVLDSLKPYFDKALEILPSYNSANTMKAGVAAEYHKLDHDYPKLIKAFEEVNLTGTYEKFILEYLKYCNKTVNNLKDAQLLAEFYKRMIRYYDLTSKKTTLPAEYRAMLKEIENRMINLQ